MERRGQQSLNLVDSTSSISNNGVKGQTKLGLNDLTLSWQARIGYKAQDKNCVFTNLMKHINLGTLHEAYKAINGKKALGVDKISKSDYGKNLDHNLTDLLDRVQSGRYRPMPKKEVLIPKANGKMRPIAIACFEDKLVDWCVGQILTQIYEPLFIRNSFGYRPSKSAHSAIEACYYSLEKGTRSNVIEIDFSNFFNTIPHKKLIKILEKRINDKRFLGIIRRLLAGDTLKTDGKIDPTLVGTPQGGIASPILANIYLNEVLDQWFLKEFGSYNNIIVRYADDAVFFFKDEDDAKSFLEKLRVRVTEYGIQLNEEKTKQINLAKRSKESFNFLGFTFYRGKQGSRKILKVKTEKVKLTKAIKEFSDWIKVNRNRRKLKDLWDLAKAKMTGHLNYYGYWMNNLKIAHFKFECEKSMLKWLNRRSQRKSYSLEGFKERLKNFPLTPDLENIKWKQLGNSFGRI
jgi:RNA-directed DNA polymerase